MICLVARHEVLPKMPMAHFGSAPGAMGLIELDKNYKEVKRYKYDSPNKNSISNNQVRVIRPDNQGRCGWVPIVVSIF